MCGIAGIFTYGASAIDRRELDRISQAMAWRGPDGAGDWISGDGRVGFAHRRLAIIDLHDRAAQPMRDPTGRLTIVFNGEIYNFRALRDTLEHDGGYCFRTCSDTEVLLALYLRHGVEMLSMLRGMFAFALHDARTGDLVLARDPYGIKPLYVAQGTGTFRFASSVKALLAGGGISREADPAGMVGFHLYGSVPEPFTLYRDIRALAAGNVMTVGADGSVATTCYANLAERLAAAVPDDSVDVGQRVADAALDSVRAHLVADVEVGTFLSGGADSGSLLGLMRDAGAQRVKAITMGFEELTGGPADEVPLARLVARHYGADHHVEVIDRQDFRDSIPQILDAMDQPSVDGINTWFVSRAARRHGLKVVLSGLGGDELLGGYDTFTTIPRLHRWGRMFDATRISPGFVSRMVDALAPAWTRDNPKALGVPFYAGSMAGAYMLSRAIMLPFELNRTLDAETVREGLATLCPVDRIAQTARPEPTGAIRQVTALESSNYMRNQLLRDSDWASMAHSLELRTPLVDWQLLGAIAPVSHRLGNKAGKIALARAPSNPLPQACLDRPRTGFTVPIGQWMRPEQTGPARTDARSWSAEVLRRFA